MDQTSAQLQAAEVPVSDAPCRGCADPCDEGELISQLGRHEEYPKFDVDMETEMLGSVKPYGRQIVISTGKSDWAREVTDASGSLAAFVSHVSSPGLFGGGGGKEKGRKEKDKPVNGATKAGVSGVFPADPAKIHKVTILNGSHRTVSDDDDKETVLVFPDYKVVTEVAVSPAGAEELWEHALSPSVNLHSTPRDTKGTSVKSWIIPYACVILLCSHKRRDNRCAIAAPKLEHTLTASLEREGWEVHSQVEAPSLSGPALEDDPVLSALASEEEQQTEILRRLHSIDAAHAESKRALILFCSHVGGHKYAGNVIINTPQGVSIWYGRVTPHEVDAIVKETIIGGRILPALLRGGMNLCHPGHKSLNDW
ncbi:Sucraseferredoxin-like protein [Lentinus tigrinus ALCF2SS1-7]|uniref:Sucraseferredoxin-like protein n=1 Tax=Lentinus tigrinus ALCF2SS1-7 TaxID=1328758 RepID=UPI001165F77A|nr:Sucraseferredoxin-like protein [Lentinus tigrinus ALCF2SS1-7]